MDEKYRDYEKLIYEYIRKNIGTVLKEPRSFIRYPFIDPGSVYDGNVWDWDTFWSVYGLLPLIKRMGDDVSGEKIIRHAQGNVRNFLDHQLEDGYIPMMIEVADWPEPYLNMRHKEHIKMNMHKPFLCQQICLISDFISDYDWICPEDLTRLEKYFSCYKKDYFHEDCGLYVWQDDIMIGMDNDPASFGRPKNSTANIFLNGFMVRELQKMSFIMKKKADSSKALFYENEATALTKAVQEELYDRRDSFFYSADIDIKTRQYDWFHKGLGVFWKSLPIRIRCWSGFIPMWAGFATQEQAQALAEQYRNRELFYSEFGLTTLARNEKMFNLEASNNPSNWLGPIWLVANYVVFRGMLNYGFYTEARQICEGSLKLLGEDLKKTGCMHEYYHPDSGMPIMNGGFINWNILVLNMVQELQEKEKDAAWGK
ncbi:MAG: trehalase / alfa-L-rhamnosidase / mannosyl oligosaccharide glucosidase [Butyrivibrio sp.]|jgi:putative isomerase|nr:trehalase / alfa-L-rhamnosidase / mannosyl oligosaccharide glucosidase [Butyrivibrio sp.]